MKKVGISMPEHSPGPKGLNAATRIKSLFKGAKQESVV